ncbi:MAG: ferritin-like domain-containing protein [Bacillota bacterium]
MNIFDFALKLEKNHKEFYLEHAGSTENKKLRVVFEELAGEEEKHEQIVQNLAEDKENEKIVSDILPRAKAAFEEIVTDLSEDNDIRQQVDVYKKAQEMETKAFNFYTEKAEETDSKNVKDAFQKLASEEKKHENILRNLTEMVNRPNTWLDDAEWYHREEY